MDRLRSILYEAAVIFLCGVAIAVVIVFVQRALHASSIEHFREEYQNATPAEREVIADKYLKVFSTAELMQSVEEQNAAGVCHVQAHPIGRALYRANKNFTDSIRQCGGSCTYGCFHGVLMEMFATDSDTLGGVIEEQSPEQYLAHVQALAEVLCEKPEVESVVQKRTCYHGLGHVFENLAHNDLAAGILSCDIFHDRKANNACVNGVFMEYLFNASSSAVSITKTQEPCSAYPDHLAQCFMYKAYGWVRAWGGVEPAMQGCDSFGENRLLCIRSVARAGATEKLMETSAGFNVLCGTRTGDEHSECIVGALLKIIYLNDGDDSDRMCDTVAKPYRDVCVKLLHLYLAENI